VLLFNKRTTTLPAVETNTIPKANSLKNLKCSMLFNFSRNTTKYEVTSVLKSESLSKTEGFYILRLCSSDTLREGFWCFPGDFHKQIAYCVSDVPSLGRAEKYFGKFPFFVINIACYF